ncbi:ATP synthase F0 subunit C [Desulfatibacillum aliphaticivorans]|uniref:ATP synthase subunit c n=1 Tax=Desulfatibacillum aliphaticivorans TaxID=218208 RepID=B8FMF2_DESAL|nr:ATP synthase F0 subunit C [Desulfatibacillum aliphaticivorans]ACL05990.1 Putative ATP synthase F0, C subunit [Desulfatibacillum aliphaticivorans]
MNDIVMWAEVAAFIGGGLAMGFGAIGAAVGEGYAAANANAAISRNPEVSGDVFKTMLVGQAVAESAAIFALVVAMLLVFAKVDDTATWMTVTVFLSSGLCMGLGAIGSGIGSGFPAGAACEGTARQPAMGGRLVTNMLIGSAVCQTPAIFALVVSFILMFTNFSDRPVNPTWAAILGAGLASGLGAIGSGLGGGLVAQASCEGVARKPEAAGTLTNVMLLGQAVTQTTAIYGMLVSFILMFKAFDPAGTTLAPAMALLSAGICMGIGAIGPGVGEGFAAQSAVGWIARNENATAELTRTMLVGQAVAESTGIYALVVALVLIFVV